MIPVRTTYLEMRSRPQTEPVALPPGCAVERWEKPGLAEYRGLFSAVGSEWGWSGRLIMKQGELKAILHAGTTEVYRLLCGGHVAGFAELDRGIAGPNGPRRGDQAEISYFGLLPAYIGHGLGRFFLDWTTRRAWEGDTERVWLHTCEYDHPRALAAYLKAGFSIFAEKTEMQAYAHEFMRKLPAAGG